MKFPGCRQHCQTCFPVILTAISGVLIISPLMPLGVVGEWLWTRHSPPDGIAEWLDRLLPALIGGTVLLGTAVLGDRLLRRPTRMRLIAMPALLVVATFLWHTLVQQTAPSPHRELKPLWVLYDKYASGYFYEAAFEIPSAQDLLGGYEDRMRQGDVLHIGTHPPGLFLMSLTAIRLTSAFPQLTEWLESLQVDSEVRTFRELEASARMQRPLTRPELAALQLLALAGRLAAALTVIPIFLLGAELSSQRKGGLPCFSSGWAAGCLFATIPSISIFMPRSDIIYPLSATTFLACACCSLQADRLRNGILLSAVGFIVLFCGMLLSLAHLPAVVVLCGFAAFRGWSLNRHSRMAILTTLLCGAAVFVLCVLTWFWLTGCQLFTVWRLNLTNHAGFYGQSPRTWWKWILVNPLELSFSVGWPMFVATLITWGTALGCVVRMVVFRGSAASNGNAFAAAAALTWVSLWLSGKNMGEAARLWCVLTPWLAVAAAEFTHVDRNSSSVLNRSNPSLLHAPRQCWPLLLIVQLLAAIVTVGSVSGYSF